MAVLHLFLGPLNLDFHASLRQVSIRPMQYVLGTLHYEEASSYSILIKCNFCNFTFWMLVAIASFALRTPLVWKY